ncbi:DUF2268 domain-containing putative Zn-dependent protease [Maricaulis sp. D1M11]|uniref:DUF2268 domain-containing putative Zn-dependent protease n=1 Tax=Maricaulis sp. D1M11 TaxID=3076117 RepID=UPI0039B4D817
MSSFLALSALAVLTVSDPVDATFASNEHHQFSAQEMERIGERLAVIHARVATDFPHLDDRVNVSVVPVNRPVLDALGGVTGRADQVDQVLIEMSVTFPGGMDAASEAGLDATFAHELHHTARGWLINGNHYGYGIQIAAINEGLATVYAEELLGTVNPSDLPPEDVEAWALEILALPQASDYGHWMFSHPDGREAIGYRTGRWVVRRAMARSGLSIIELSDMTPEAIWRLAGYDWDRALR